MNWPIGTSTDSWLASGITAPTEAEWGAVLGEIAAAGVTVVEPRLTSAEDVAALAGALAGVAGGGAGLSRGGKQRVAAPMSVVTAVVPTNFSDGDWEAEAARVVEVATAAKAALSLRTVVVGRHESAAAPPGAAAISRESEAMQWVVSRLARRGVDVAWHATTADLDQGARGLHHMMVSTRNIGLRLYVDVPQLFEGYGRSLMPVLDLLTLYSGRIGGVRIGQSRAGVPADSLADGDIDHRLWLKQLARADYNGHLTLDLRRAAGYQGVSITEIHRRAASHLQEAVRAIQVKAR